MKLSEKLKKQTTKHLIYRINELYHDFENKLYSQLHPEIFIEEKDVWEAYCKKFILNDKPFHILDYGTGTGFVASIICNHLKKSDSLICVDLSKEILKVCENNLSKLNPVCQLVFAKIDGENIPLENKSVDIITVNSVLHHLPDLSVFSNECFRVLKDNGLLIIAHEPNNDTKLPMFENLKLKLLQLINQPELVMLSLLEKFSFLEWILRKITSKINNYYFVRNKMLKDIAQILINENLIDYHLRGSEIQQLVDIHTENGFNIKYLTQEIFTNFELIESCTKNYTANDSTLARRINKKLQIKYPHKGLILSLVLKKRVDRFC